MANLFPSTNAYNGQYAQPPFYPPYMQNPGQTNRGHSVTTPLPIPPLPPPLSANAQRFEANSHVPSPPLPGQLPLNPEVLRQLAASGNLRFPFPPPPPPPPPQLFAASFPPNQQGLGATAPPGLHQFQPFQHPRPQFQTATPPLSHTAKANDNNTRHINIPQDQNGNIQSNAVHLGVNGSKISQPQIAHSLDGATFSRVAGAFSNGTPTSSSAANIPQVETVATPDKAQARAPTLRAELHLKAKTAIKECLPIGADYDFWLQSGVDSAVLDVLFDELNIDRHVSHHHTADNNAGSTNQPQSSVQESSSHSLKQDPLPSSQTPQPEALDRKDRIARLLAAKKGQPLASAKSSQSGSPAPERMVRPQATLPIQNETKPQDALKLDVTENDDAAKILGGPVAPVEPAVLSSTSSSTPGRSQPQQSIFAIPGLFMTSADEAEFEKQQLLIHEKSAATNEVSTNSQLAGLKSLKRRAETLSEDALPQNKRQASYAVTTPAQPSDTVEMPSLLDQTISAESLPALQATIKQPTSDSEKTQDNSVTPNRSKVNQSVLKDRMAALKAQLQMSKARKEALQDGMPMLAAEVEKTRQSLEERHTRLAIIRKDIEVKDAEVMRLRGEENEVLQDIRRLDSQLVDGENGQRQFSNELNQLDSQIQVNETESADSQRSAALVSPTETARPTTASSRLASTDKPMPRSESVSDQTVAQEEPVHNEASAVRSGLDSLRRSLTTEYNPEQADLDRQLEAGPVSSIQDATTTTSEGSFEKDTDYTPEPGASTGISAVDEQQSEIDSEDDRMSIDEASDDGSSGSASMSDSGSEDYEPALNQNETKPDVTDENENDDYEPAEPDQMYVDADNDDYEPAEQVDIIDVEELEDNTDSHGRPSGGPSTTLDTSLPKANGALVEDITPISSSPTLPTSTSQTSPVVMSVDQMDQKLTTPQQPAAIDSFPVLAPLSDGEKPVVSRFVPYQSPLASFKSFRFHPQFSDVVKNGFRSLTYSNNIDPKTPICLNELEGRFCDDVKCVDQHFGSMGLTDDKILVQMSSANDLKDKDQRDAYLLGLKKVIADLRGKGVREFSEVANALSKYRREWLQAQDGIVA